MTDEQPDEDSRAQPDDLKPIALIGEAGPEAIIDLSIPLSRLSWSANDLDRLIDDTARRIRQRRWEMHEAVREAQREKQAAEHKLMQVQSESEHFEKTYKAFFQ